ncbi:hypothetical protein OTSGILL_2477, partial [Orientia tsutsugamushi str. Gilliam]
MYPQNASEVVVHESGFLFIGSTRRRKQGLFNCNRRIQNNSRFNVNFTPKTPNPVMLVNAATKIEEKDNSKQNNTNLFSNDLNTKELTAKPSKNKVEILRKN